MILPGRSRRGKGKAELCMTPMIDIVFNLVIFFLLMPSFEAAEGYLPTNMPDAGPHVRPPRDCPQTLRIDLLHVEPFDLKAGDVSIVLNGETLSNFGELRQRLRQAWSRLADAGKPRARMVVLISPDMGVWHKHVVAAFDAAVDAGFESIRFTVPQ